MDFADCTIQTVDLWSHGKLLGANVVILGHMICLSHWCDFTYIIFSKILKQYLKMQTTHGKE